MAQALQIVHNRDPREELLEAMAPYVADVPTILGPNVLVAVYEPPKDAKTSGGIIVPDRTKAEYEYQGKTGLVVAKSALAFAEDATHKFGGRVPQVGDWVLFRVGDTFPMKLGDKTCRIIEDVDVKAILSRPDVVW